MACGCQGGQYGTVAEPAQKAYESAPKDAPVRRFEGVDAYSEARQYAARNGGGRVREVD